MKEAEMGDAEQPLLWRIISEYPYVVAMPMTAILTWAVLALVS